MINEGISKTYTNIEEINKGGTGTIFRAFHKNLGKYVILKKISSNSANVALLRREVDILKNLRHRYLPVIYDYIAYNGSVYLVEDYIKGYDLSYYIRNKIVISESQILKWLKQMCEVLEYIHSRKPAVVHSDIKPGNIMIDENMDICLIDFNISIIQEKDKNVIGFSKSYCSPEQYLQAKMFFSGQKGKMPKVDARSDIYSTCATFYSLLTFLTPSSMKVNYPLTKMPSLPYSEGLLGFIDKGMSQNPNNRFQSAKQMTASLGKLNTLTFAYKKYTFLRILVSVIGAIIFSVGVTITIYGTYQDNTRFISDKIESIIFDYEEKGALDVYDDIESIILDKVRNKFLKMNDKAPNIYTYYGEYLENNKDSVDCITYYKKALDIILKNTINQGSVIKNNIKFIINCIRAYIKYDQPQKAKDLLFNELDDIANTDEKQMLLSIIDIIINYYSENDYAVMTNVEKMDKHSYSSEYYYLMVEMYSLASDSATRLEEYSQAVYWNEKIVALVQNVQTGTDLLISYINAVEGIGQNNQTSDYLNKAKSYYESNPFLKSDNNARLYYAVSLFGLGKYAESLDVLKEIKTMIPEESSKVHYYLSLNYYSIGQYSMAKKQCETAIQIYSDNLQNNIIDEKYENALTVLADRVGTSERIVKKNELGD